MTDTLPGPLCVSHLEADWNDPGTLALQCSRTPSGWNECAGVARVPYPREVSDLAAMLIREGYVFKVGSLLPPSWGAMSESELTAYLSNRYSQSDLGQMFLMRYEDRQLIKGGFRKVTLVTALVIALIWARENIRQGEWGEAAAKVLGSFAGSLAFNKILYARDLSAKALMESKGDRFGRWFKGVARTSRFVNMLVRMNVIADIAAISLSGGGEYPSIPWDIIFEIDIDDEATWRAPPDNLLSLGFNIWYRQKSTAAHPEAAAGNVYIGYVEGHLIKTVLENTFLSKSAL